MGKKHICGELDAQKIIISFYTRSPQVLWAYIFKDVYVVGAWFIRTKALKLKKAKREKKVMETKWIRRRTKEFGPRRRIFGVWPCSMGSTLGDYLMHHAGGTLLR